MKPSTLALFAMLGFCVARAGAADATTPIDYTQRNAPYAPGDSIAPQKKKPVGNPGMQERRVDKIMVEKPTSPLRDREAPVEVKEAGPKEVRAKESHRPDLIEHATSHFDQRRSNISTASDTSKPPTVAKYQDSLTAASAVNMARFPAVDRATTAKINRFVFRKNPSESPGTVGASTIVPAAGGAGVRK